MPNAKDHQPGSNQKLLVVGGPGSGKTTLLTTFPGKKFVYVFDPNALESLSGADVQYECFIPDQVNLDAIPLSNEAAARRNPISDPGPPVTYNEFEEHFESRLHDGFFSDFDVIGFDSLSTLQEIVLDQIMFLNQRWGRHPEQADWTAAQATLMNLFRTLTNMQQFVYCTAHYEYRQDNKTKRFGNQISTIGVLRNRLPLRFTDIWLSFADHEGDEQKYFVQTQSDKDFPFLRSSKRFRTLGFEEDVTIVDFDNPEKYGISALIKRVS